ncbi:MAG: hypothetical protein K8823_1542 [Cenarchaeum symbiont of Oopsacas minuta]|nr:hypothetical protein [Cenarchaeum symbiont of Oopsacas minuta]
MTKALIYQIARKIDGKFIDEFDEPKDVFLTAYEDVESVGRESDYYYTGYNPSTCKFAVFVSSRPIRQLHTPWLDIRCVLGIEFKNEAGRMLNEEGYIPLTIQMLQQEMRYKHDLH